MKCGALIVATTLGVASAEANFFKQAHLRSSSVQDQSLVLAHKPKPHNGGLPTYGDVACPCIGFDNIDGKTMIDLGDGKKQVYPADLGARCEAWDDGRYPGDCQEGGEPGNGKGWCAQPWCFVDPCNCNLDIVPKPSVYLPDAMFRGRPVYFSYATCGGKDHFTKKVHNWGKPGCRCIGIAGVPGTLEYSIGEDQVAYPAETGGTCKAWDNGRHADCQGEDPPHWCKEHWCYVDPCECDLTGIAVPKLTSYLPEASYHGKALFYSYEACGGKDHWTKGNPKACVNQKNKDECDLLGGKCGWTGEQCVGKELADPSLCPKPPALEEEEVAAHEEEPVKNGVAQFGSALWCTSLVLAAVRV